MSCPQARPAPLRCPSIEDVHAQLLALLPHGRAWQSQEGGPAPGSVLSRYWMAAADVFTFANTRACDLKREFFCATRLETDDLWHREYGLPDPCDPFPDLCAKVAALGGTRCEYYAAVARRAGWEIECAEEIGACGGEAGCFEVGCDEVSGGVNTLRLIITVHLAESPAYRGAYEGQPNAGCMTVGMPLACEPNIDPLKCLMARMVHAELEIVYLIVPPPIFIMADAETHIMDETGALFVAE